MPNIGPLELVIVLGIVLIIFGPKRLPGLGRQLGSGLREFKDSIGSITGKDDDEEQGKAESPKATERASLSAATPQPASPHAAVEDPEVVTGEARPQDQPVSHAD